VDNFVPTTEKVADSVTKIANGSLEITQSIQNQSHLTGNIQKIIVDTSMLSQELGSLSNSSEKALAEGQIIVNKLSEISEDVKINSENVYTSMSELKEKSKEIHQITGLIKGLSVQTNLLSLNASIESARAGAAGKGFAVVAEEIKKLAYKSKDSASEISLNLNELQRKADQSLSAVSKLKSLNYKQNDLINQTRIIFESIIEKMSMINTSQSQIHGKMNQIVLSNNDMVNNITGISGVTKEASESTHGVNLLTEQSISQAILAKKMVEELIETSNEMNKYFNVMQNNSNSSST
jgi:methyl-accepting chemotaxis protein